MATDTLVLILAGGFSRRMGRDKAALPFGEGTMLSTLIARFQSRWPVAVSVRQAGQFPLGNIRELADEIPGLGPLCGLQTVFHQTEAQTVFLTGTDLPFLSVRLTEAMLSLAASQSAYDAWVVQRADGRVEPLCGVYRRSCAPAVDRCLSQGKRSFHALFRELNIRYVREEELTGFDLAHELDNLNTPEDYARVLRQ